MGYIVNFKLTCTCYSPMTVPITRTTDDMQGLGIILYTHVCTMPINKLSKN